MCDHDTAAEEKKKSLLSLLSFLHSFCAPGKLKSAFFTKRQKPPPAFTVGYDSFFLFSFFQSALCSLCSFVLGKTGKDEKDFP